MLHFLGVGSAFNPSMGSTAAFNKYNNGKDMLLLDCGESTFGDIMKLGLLYGVERLYIAITHFHPDHFGSLGSLIFYCAHILKMKPILYDTDYSMTNTMVRTLDMMGVDPNLYLLSDDIPYIKRSVLVSHCFNMDNLMYVVSDNTDTCLYTGDTFDIDEVMKCYKEEKCTVYTDFTTKDYVGNPHMSLASLNSNLTLEERKDFCCMHFSSLVEISSAKFNGFSIAKRAYPVSMSKVYSIDFYTGLNCGVFHFPNDKYMLAYPSFKKFVEISYEGIMEYTKKI